MRVTYRAPGLALLLALALLVCVPVVAGASELQAIEPDETAAPTITVWYGSTQNFGMRGNPQQWVNILGNVEGANLLEYSLNGGPFVEVARAGGSPTRMPSPDEINWHPGGISQAEGPVEGKIPLPEESRSPEGAAPDGLLVTSSQRLVSPGDFNIEIDTKDLVSGANSVLIRAKDGEESTKVVTVNYTAGNRWPLPYTIDWGLVTNINDVAQIVDGQWQIQNGGIRPTVTGYDRVVAIGDLAWEEYDVRVPITIHGFPLPDAGGVGVAARWLGHFQVVDEQPGAGWWNLGAYGLYRNRIEGGQDKSKLWLYTGHYDILKDESGFRLETGVPYTFQMRVLSKGWGDGGFYSFRAWEAGQPEPAGWTFAVQDSKPLGWQPGDLMEAPDSGSVLLVAHQVDATFGDVEIRPVLDLSVSSIGSGAVSVSPTLVDASDAYLYGDQIQLQAVAAPGSAFIGWTGGLTGSQNPATLTLVADTAVSARFGTPRNLQVGVSGSGSVERIPDEQQYGDGTVVLLRPQPNAGWRFTGWDGPNSNDLVDTGNGAWSLKMDGDKTVTAVFERGRVLLPLVVRSR